MSIILAKEKYKLAMLALVSPGDIHSRVATALGNYIFHLDCNIDLPESAKVLHNQLYNDLGITAGSANHVRSSIEQMTEIEVERIAQHIVNAYDSIASSH